MVAQPSLTVHALRRERLLVIAALALMVVVSWGYLLAGAGMQQEMGGMLMPMSSGPWTPGRVLVVVVMWIAMMPAMMLPSAVPMVLFHAAIARQRPGPSAGAGTSSGAFVLGYLAIWSLFAFAATALQYALQRLGLLSPMMHTTSILVAGSVLVAAGAYQWSPLKRACLQRCRSPLAFVMAHWCDGASGAFAMGARHGAACLGCCWLLMLLLFVGGVMNLSWIAGISVFVAVEKLAPAGHWVGRAAGVLLVAWGFATWLSAA